MDMVVRVGGRRNGIDFLRRRFGRFWRGVGDGVLEGVEYVGGTLLLDFVRFVWSGGELDL